MGYLRPKYRHRIRSENIVSDSPNFILSLHPTFPPPCQWNLNKKNSLCEFVWVLKRNTILNVVTIEPRKPQSVIFIPLYADWSLWAWLIGTGNPSVVKFYQSFSSRWLLWSVTKDLRSYNIGIVANAFQMCCSLYGSVATIPFDATSESLQPCSQPQI